MRIMESVVRGQLAVQDGIKSAQRRLAREDGASAVEYALMVGLIAIVIIAAVTLLGNKLSNTFNKAQNALSA